jgi:hypothetical protein
MLYGFILWKAVVRETCDEQASSIQAFKTLVEFYAGAPLVLSLQ